MNSNIYLDTSALMKRYLNEWNSDVFDAYFIENAPFTIGRTTFVEIEHLFVNNIRLGNIKEQHANMAKAAFMEDVAEGFLIAKSLSDEIIMSAKDIVWKLEYLAVSPAEVIHLAMVIDMNASAMITASHTLQIAANKLGIDTRYFGTAPEVDTGKGKPIVVPQSPLPVNIAISTTTQNVTQKDTAKTNLELPLANKNNEGVEKPVESTTSNDIFWKHY